ncbi:MAG: hypothetical protein LQ340_000374 [Diploschistes diacapsis]|nr:MAG: hypothetical protein LQ340_000374 [Diploschistes diacapsis]
MSSAPLLDQHISGTSATDGSIALAAYRPPKASFIGPFQRDTHFVDRGDLLSRIDKLCSQPAGRAAFVGLGGVGKSRLAIEYAYRVRERSPDTWVFWVHASNAARFGQSYGDIADAVKIPWQENPEEDMFKQVHDWLRGHQGKWLIVLDNVDDARYLLKAKPKRQSQIAGPDNGASRSLWECIPKSPNGSLLITSRSKEAALELVKVNETIPVEPMSEAQATELCKKKLGSEVPQIDEDIAKLVVVLEFMPLAIVQAAAYILQLAPLCSVREYTQKFQKSDRSKAKLLDSDGGYFHSDGEVKKPILRTWQIPFEHILQARPSAANLLSLMSFFDSQGIPEALVRNRSRTNKARGNTIDKECDEDSDDESSASGSEDDEFKVDISTLRNYSFVSISKDISVFEMHKLVQLATRKWLEANKQLEVWKQQYIKILYEEFPTAEYQNWAKCQNLFAHTQTVVAQRPQKEESLLQWASILSKGGEYAWYLGHRSIAEEMGVKAMKARKKLLGQEERETLRSMSQVGQLYNITGRLKEAEELEVQALEISQRVFSQEDPDTLISMARLAWIYRNQGR